MKRCLIIINPSSGKHIIQNKLDRIIGQLTLQNIVEHFEIFYTEKKDDAYYKAKDCDENQYDFIMSVGGDGTLNEVISWMVDSHKKIGEHLFSFDKKKIYNLFYDYPHNLTEEEKEIFDRENPYWKEFFKDRR